MVVEAWFRDHQHEIIELNHGRLGFNQDFPDHLRTAFNPSSIPQPFEEHLRHSGLILGITDDAVVTVAGVDEMRSASGIGSSVTDPVCEAAGC